MTETGIAGCVPWSRTENYSSMALRAFRLGEAARFARSCAAYEVPRSAGYEEPRSSRSSHLHTD